MKTFPGNREAASAPLRERALKVAIFGFGTVGSSVARILVDRRPAGLELTHIYNRSIARKKAPWVPASVTWTEDAGQAASAADVLVELAGGRTDALGWVEQALRAGKSVVTANKQLIAYEGLALERIAAERGGQLFYGAAVAGGIPVIPAIQQGLAGDSVERILGILNGTSNFLLSAMEEGQDLAPVLAEAQRLGYAEADPSEDVDGYDARAKLTILMRLALRAEVNPEQIRSRSLLELSSVDFAYARDLDSTIRQISRAEWKDGALLAAVGPMLVPRRMPLAWSRGTENMVISTGHYGGNVVFSGHGAGGHPTAVAVVSDLLALSHGSRAVSLPARPAVVASEPETPHYIRFIVRDRPGIVAEIAGALAEQHINIDAILQKPGHPAEALPFVVTVGRTPSSAVARALETIARMECLLAPPLDLPVLED